MIQEQATFVVQVQPNARQNKVIRFKEGILYLKIAAPPVKGKANEELTRFLSDILGVGKSKMSIEKGMTGKRKTIVIKGLRQSYAMRQLEKLRMNQGKKLIL